MECEHEERLEHPGPVLFCADTSTMPFVLWPVPTMIDGGGLWERLSQLVVIDDSAANDLPETAAASAR